MVPHMTLWKESRLLSLCMVLHSTYASRVLWRTETLRVFIKIAMEHFINGKQSCLEIEKKEKKLTWKNWKQVFDNLETWSNFESQVVYPKLLNVSEYKILRFVILHKKACQFWLIVSQYFQQFDVFFSFKNCWNLNFDFNFSMNNNTQLGDSCYFIFQVWWGNWYI